MWILTVLSVLLALVAGPQEHLQDQPPVHRIKQAIIQLAPRHVQPLARQYACIIRQEASRRNVDSFLVVAFIHVETAKHWNPRLRSKTNDFGLTQVHVAPRGSADFLGREGELYDPRTNIREWARLAAMWRAYHVRTCKVGGHLWWAHLKYGYRVKPDLSHSLKVLRLLRRLHERFGTGLEVTERAHRSLEES